MIHLHRTPRERMRDAHLRAEPPEPAPDPINLGPLSELWNPPILTWADVRYRTRLLSVPEAIELQRILLVFKNNPADDVEARAEAYDRACELFWTLLLPAPAENPFFDLLHEELGELAGFFLMSLTKRSGQSRLAKTQGHLPPSTH